MRGTKQLLAAAVVAVVMAAGVIIGAAAPASAGTHGGFQGPIYFRQAGPAGIQRINPDGSGLQTLVPQSIPNSICGNWTSPEEPAISKDGRMLAFTMHCDNLGGRYLFVMDVTVPGSYRALHPFERNFAQGESPTWSPDGLSLIYSRNRGDGSDTKDLFLYVVEQNGQPSNHNDFQLTVSPQGYHAENPEWSPNGRWVAYALMNRSFVTGGGSDVRVTDATFGSGVADRVLQTFAAHSTTAPHPSWRPDSAQVVFSLDQTGPILVSVDGNGARTSSRPVFGAQVGDRYPTFAPRSDAASQGDTIVVTRRLDQFWFIRSTENAGSQRGPIAGGRGTTWSTSTPVPQRPTQTAPVRETVTQVQRLLAGAGCPSAAACDIVRPDPLGGSTLAAVLRLLPGGAVVGQPPATTPGGTS